MNYNLIKSTALFILLIFTCTQSLHAQKLEDIKKSKGGYIMNNNFFHKKDMKELFKDSNTSMDLYRSAKKQRVAGHITLGLGAASSVFGLAMMYGNRSTGFSNAPFSDLSNNLKKGYSDFGMGMVVLGVGLGTISIVNYAKSNKNYKRALQEYNMGNLKVKDSTRDEIIMKTNIKGNGLGLSFNF